jgi:hypothetical protein
MRTHYINAQIAQAKAQFDLCMAAQDCWRETAEETHSKEAYQMVQKWSGEATYFAIEIEALEVKLLRLADAMEAYL